MRIALILTTLLAALLLLGSSFFSVDRAEYAYVTWFGRPVVTYDGEKEDEAGLHWKWPWPVQSVQRIDHRLQVFDLPAAELLTHDPRGQTVTIDRTLTISAYVCWQIAGAQGVDRFIKTIGTPDRATAILGQRISSRLGAAIGNMRLEELISVAPGKEVEQRMDRLSQRLLDQGSTPEGASNQDSLRVSARSDYGIELVDIRLRRFNYPPQVREEIFSRIRSERQKKVVEYQSEGEQVARKIGSEAEFESRTMLADARAREQLLKGQAEADADRIRSEAQAKDVAFYTFLRKLAGYQQILGDNKTVLLLSSHRDLFDVLFNPPNPGNGSPTPATTAGSVSARPTDKNGGH
jgi:membrane protease subunit HflC